MTIITKRPEEMSFAKYVTARSDSNYVIKQYLKGAVNRQPSPHRHKRGTGELIKRYGV